MKKITGFTLLELVIAFCLSGIFILMLETFYSAFMRQAFELKKTAEQLENTRYASFFLRNLFSQAISIKGLSDNDTLLANLKAKKFSDICEVTSTRKGQDVISHLFVGKSVISSSVGNKIYSLFLKEEHKPRIEVVSGFCDIRLVFGIRCENSLNICRYAKALEVSNWAQVASIKLRLFSDYPATPRCLSLYIALKKNT